MKSHFGATILTDHDRRFSRRATSLARRPFFAPEMVLTGAQASHSSCCGPTSSGRTR